jgi:hypothetical protein
MAMSDDPDLNRVDQDIRINELREAIQEAAGGEMHVWESPDAPPEIIEQFWQNVLQYEQAEETTHFAQLERAGVALPPPEELSDEELTDKLWEVIHALARMNVYLSQTDHWSDRELYERLWRDTLREFTMDFPPGSGWNCHIDFLSSGSDENNFLYLKHYANEEERQRWSHDWPDDVIPPHEKPVYDRDVKLPKPLRP